MTSIPDSALGPERIRALLVRFGCPEPSSELVDGVRKNLGVIEPIDHAYRMGFRMGRTKVYGPREVDHVDQLSCTCSLRPREVCAHRGAAVLEAVWRHPRSRVLFERAPWEIALMDLELVRSAAEGREPGHDGYVLYEVMSPEWSGRLEVRREVIRLSKRDGRPLKPIRYPKKLADLEAKIAGVTDADRAFHELTEQIDELSKLADRSWGSARNAQRILGRLYGQWAEAFAGLDRVVYEGRPVRVRSEPLQPRLEAVEETDGLRLRWRPPVARLWAGPPAWVMTLSDIEELRPLHPAFGDPKQLLRPLPHIPASDVDRFVKTYVMPGKLPFDLGDAPKPSAERGTFESRLTLSEDGEDLIVTPSFAYVVEDEVVEIDPFDDSPYVRGSEEGPGHLPAMVRREHSAETARLAQLRTVLPELPARLFGEDAWDFLTETLPEWTDEWVVYGREGLVKNKVQARVTPRISVPTETDWFDLDVRFVAGRTHVPAAPILQSWAERRRYVRLPDGVIAKLPKQWLETHGDTLQELQELKRGGAKLGGEVVPLARDLLEQATGNVARWRQLAERLGGFDGVEERDPPEALTATLRDYQVRGYRWLCFLRDHRLGGCLADDMGLGKTVQTLAALVDTHAQRDGPSLVVCPTSVVFNWKREAERFAPGLKVYVHHGPDREEEIPTDVDLVLTTYPLLRIDRERLEPVDWIWVVLDEAQHIKNPTSQVSRAARAMDALYRVALTGTPIENNLHELYSLFQFLMPGFFGAHRSFTRRYATPIHRHQDTEALAALRQRIRPFILRRLKSEVASELPPRQEMVLTCEFDPPHRKLYERVRETFRHSVLGRDANKLHVLEALTRLRQACCHPDLLPFPEARAVQGSPKLDLLLETLIQAEEEGHRSLVFSQWPSLLKMVAERLDHESLPYLYLDGSTRKRSVLVDEFNDPDGPPVFLISLKAGGTGLNLTAADHVFHLDPWWNPAVEDQATDRAHRIGQTKPVVSYKLVVKDTVEEKILELQERKRHLTRATVDTDRLVVDDLTHDELVEVFAADPRDP